MLCSLGLSKSEAAQTLDLDLDLDAVLDPFVLLKIVRSEIQVRISLISFQS